MRYHLIAHHHLLSDASRYPLWREALARQRVEIAAIYDLAEPDWAARVQRAFQPDDRVLALGGDGTQSSVAHQCVEHGWPLAILPAGTANDFARALEVPTQADAACRLLKHGQLQRIDVGRLNGRLFLNVAHIGLGAQVALSVGRQHKRLWGPFSYLWQLLRIVSGRRRFWARIETDGRQIYGRWLEIALANGPSFGGGHLVDGAGHGTGALTLVAIRARPLPKVLLAWVMARIGRPMDRKLVRIEHVQQCKIQTRRRMKMTADGERFGKTPAEFAIEPQRLDVLCPLTEETGQQREGKAEVNVLDQQHDVMLYGISGRGFELAERYRDLAGLDALPATMAEELQQLALERERLMEAFGEEVVQEGGLPKAGNPDREFIESLADRWLSTLSGPQAAFNRLREAEQLWLDDIVVLSQEQWSEPLTQLLIELSQHGHHCQARLQKLGDQCAPLS